MDDFWDFSKPLKKIVISGGASAGRRKPDPELMPKPIQRPDLGTDYTKEYVRRQEEEMASAFDTLTVTDNHSLSTLDDEHEDQDPYDPAAFPVSDALMAETINLYKKYRFNGLPQQHDLNIHQDRKEIVQTIVENPVVVIRGPTGCGKTTQVPQYILDDAAKKGQFCNIIVTQPRRLAAVTVARRVATERGCDIGTLIGYQIGLERKVNEDTRITYCTTGVLLRHLVTQKNMNRYTHVIIDEVHERETETDFLLLLVRKFLSSNSKSTKVVLMSATIDTDKFAAYFKTRKAPRSVLPAPTFNLSDQRRYRVTEYYLNDLPNLDFDDNLDVADPGIDEKRYRIASDIVFTLISNFKTKAEESDDPFSPAILIFLPGIYEIRQMAAVLQRRADNMGDPKMSLHIVQLHSTTSSVAQREAFTKTRRGVYKVILSTNIAESSVTVPDVKAVVDFCLTKHLVTDTGTNCTSLRLDWASKSACIQRAGRAGRCSAGRVYRLVWRSFYKDEMEEDDVPEMLRCPLENTVLQAKLLDQGNPKSILALAMDPPNLTDIQNTILLLKELGALTLEIDGTYCADDGDLTFIGRVMSELPLEVHATRLILFGYMFNVLDEAVIMAAGVNARKVFLGASRDDPRVLRAYTDRLAWADGSGSDLFAILYAYRYWVARIRARIFSSDAAAAAERMHIDYKGLEEMHALVEELKTRLERLGLREMTGHTAWRPNDAEKALILKVCIAGAFYPFFFTRQSTAGYEHKERAGFHDLNGRDPCTTIFYRGLDSKKLGLLYTDQMKDFLRFNEVIRSYDEVKISFDPGCEKIFVAFLTQRDCVERPQTVTSAFDRHELVPGRIALQMYKALKLGRERVHCELRILSDLEARKYASDNGIKLNDQGAAPVEAVTKYADLCVLPDLYQQEMVVRVTHVNHPNQFWVRAQPDPVYHGIKQLLNGKVPLQVIDDADPTELNEGNIVAVPYIDGNETVKVRAKMLGLSTVLLQNKGGQERGFEVTLIDFGCSLVVTRASIYSLRGLTVAPESLGIAAAHAPRLAVADIPPRAIECTLASIQPSYLKSTKGKWTPEAIQTFKELMTAETGMVTLQIYSVWNGIASVVAYNDVNVNRQLDLEGFAQRCEENYISKADHAKRAQNRNTRSQQQRKKHQAPAVTRVVTEEYKAYIREFFTPNVLNQPNRDDCRRRVMLRGPYSPLEATLHSATRIGREARVSIEPESVNSVLLDTDPQDPTDRLVVAASINKKRDVMLRNTTVMPQIHGFPVLMALLFCPRAELHRDAEKYRINSVLTGLGYDRRTGQAYYPEHDLALSLDSSLLPEDVEIINQLRYYFSMLLLRPMPTEEAPNVNDEQVKVMQRKIYAKLAELLSRSRDALDVRSVGDPFKWGQMDRLPADEVFVGADLLPNAIFPSLKMPVLEKESQPKRERLQRQAEELHRLAWIGGTLTVRDLHCELCNMPIENYGALQTHLYTKLHCDREAQIDFQRRERR